MDSAKSENGTPVLFWEYHNGENQKWGIETQDSHVDGVGGVIVLSPAFAPNSALDADNYPHIWDIHRGAQQRFVIYRVAPEEHAAGDPVFEKRTNDFNDWIMKLEKLCCLLTEKCKIPWNMERLPEMYQLVIKLELLWSKIDDDGACPDKIKLKAHTMVKEAISVWKSYADND